MNWITVAICWVALFLFVVMAVAKFFVDEDDQ